MLKKWNFAGCTFGLGFALLLGGCAPPEDAPPSEPDPEPPHAVVMDPEPAPPEDSLSPEPSPEPVEDAMPNWKERFASYKAEFAQEFRPLSAGAGVTLKLKSGGTTSGKLVSLEGDQVILQVSDGEVGFPRNGLTPETRARLYADDYAHLKALQKVKTEESEYQKEQSRLAALEQERARVERPRSTSGALNRSKPVVDPRDGSVLQVKEYLETHSRHPESLRYLKWGKIQKDKDGFKVTCIYKLRSGEFGDSTESKYFFMNAQGKVLRTAAYRGGQVE